MSRTIVVIGGAGGGPVAAARARELDEHARIVLVEKRPHVSWVQAGLRHHLEGKVTRLAELDEDRRQFFADRHRIEVRLGTEAVRLDPDSHRLVLRASNGQQDTLRYDAAIFSGGAEIRDAGGGLAVGQPGVVGFRTRDDLEALQALIKGGAKTAVVVGAGPFGVDAAVGLHRAGLRVHMVEKNERVLPSLSLLAARAAQQALIAQGITLHLRDPIASVDKSATRSRLVLASGKALDADIVVLTTGLRPRTDLLADAGAALNADGSVRVNAKMETSLPSIYACGTAVSVTHAVTRAPLWLPQQAIATRTAQIAGHNAVADGWSPERVADLDIAYTPTLGPAFDPLHIAGQIAAQTLSGEANPIGAEALALRVLKGDVVLVDVSRPNEGTSPWPQSALRIPLEALRERLVEVPLDRPVVTVSQTGQRAYQAYRILKQRGLTQVQHLDGGALSYAFTLD